jgi:hypothetical protein
MRWPFFIPLGTAQNQFNFVQISDIHYDPIYSLKDANEYCHEYNSFMLTSSKINDYYGSPGSSCDSPLSLLNETFKYLKEFSRPVDVVFWTGDSSRHNRDSAHPKSLSDLKKQVRFVTNMMKDTFRNKPVLPTIGNWDTRTVSASSSKDYLFLYNQWKDFWPLDKLATINGTFLQGGYYSYDFDGLTVISINTLLWFNDNPIRGIFNLNQIVLIALISLIILVIINSNGYFKHLNYLHRKHRK